MNGRTCTFFVLAALVLAGCRSAEPEQKAEKRLAERPRQDTATPGPGKRLAYPWSVVSGGLATPLAMRQAIAEDPVVREHYAGLNPAAFRVETLGTIRRGYVSYRIRDKIYWTRRRVTLRAGESVLTDGQITVRGRCGNLISPIPRDPAAPPGLEPVEIAMDQPVSLAQLVHTPELPSGEWYVPNGTLPPPSSQPAGRERSSGLPSPDPMEPAPPSPMSGAAPGPPRPILGTGIIAGGGQPASLRPAPELPGHPLPFAPPGTAVESRSIPTPAGVPPQARPPETALPDLLPLPPTGPPHLPPPPFYYPPAPTAPPPAYLPPPRNPPPNGPPPGGPPKADPPPAGPQLPPPFPAPPNTPVPEPRAWTLVVLGLACIGIGILRRKA